MHTKRGPHILVTQDIEGSELNICLLQQSDLQYQSAYCLNQHSGSQHTASTSTVAVTVRELCITVVREKPQRGSAGFPFMKSITLD